MLRPQLCLLDLLADGEDSLALVQARSTDERFFPPLLAAQLLLDVRGLVHQSCFSRPLSAKPRSDRQSREARRWALAQEIFSNAGRGTEAGHFLEHLTLEMLTTLPQAGRRRFSAETSWDFRAEPELFRLRFFKIEPVQVREALQKSAEVLSRRDYRLELPETALRYVG